MWKVALQMEGETAGRTSRKPVQQFKQRRGGRDPRVAFAREMAGCGSILKDLLKNWM